MKERIIAAAVFILAAVLLFSFSWPYLRDVVLDEVRKVDSVNVTIPMPSS